MADKKKTPKGAPSGLNLESVRDLDGAILHRLADFDDDLGERARAEIERRRLAEELGERSESELEKLLEGDDGALADAADAELQRRRDAELATEVDAATEDAKNEIIDSIDATIAHMIGERIEVFRAVRSERFGRPVPLVPDSFRDEIELDFVARLSETGIQADHAKSLARILNDLCFTYWKPKGEES